MKNKLRFTLLACCLGVAGMAHADYSLTDLGLAISGNNSSKMSMNDNGQIVGTDSNGGFLWQGGSLSHPFTLGGHISGATGINNSGQVTGYATDAYGEDQAFIYSGGTTTGIGGFNYSYPEGAGINNLGDVAGTLHDDPDNNYYAFTYKNGNIQLHYPLGGYFSIGEAINDSDVVAGYAQTSNNVYHAVTWSGYGGPVALGDYAGGHSSGALAINDSGEVVGFGTKDSGYSVHALLWNGAGAVSMSELAGTSFSQASALNASGDIVGLDSVGGSQVGVLWHNGQVIDLNTMLGQNSGWLITEADAIDAHGNIAGYGYHNGVYSAFYAQSVPEPFSMTALGLGAIGLLRRKS